MLVATLIILGITAAVVGFRLLDQEDNRGYLAIAVGVVIGLLGITGNPVAVLTMGSSYFSDNDYNSSGRAMKWIDFNRYLQIGSFDHRGVEIHRADVMACEGVTDQGMIEQIGVTGTICPFGPNGVNLILGTPEARQGLARARQ